MKYQSRLFAISLAAGCLAVCLFAAAAQAAAPAWLPIAASGPTNLPPRQNDIQRVAVDAEGGFFRLIASAAAASGTGTAKGASSEIKEVITEKGKFEVGQVIEGECIPSGAKITSISGVEPNLIIKTSAGNSGGCAPSPETLVAVGASEETAPISFGAKASEVESALNALAVINTGGGSVTLTGGPGDKGANNPYFVNFGGALAGANQPMLIANAGLLSGGNNHSVAVSTVLDGGPGTTTIALYAQNVGGVPSSGTTTLSFTLPTGVKTLAAPGNTLGGGWSCAPTDPGQSAITCTTSSPTPPGFSLHPIKAPVIAGPGAASGIVHVTVSGGGAAGTAEYNMPLVVSAVPAPPGLQSFTAGAYDENGLSDTRAGAHPYSASAGIMVNTIRGTGGKIVPAGEFRDIVVDTPPGFLGNPISTPQCPEFFEQTECDQKSIVATAQITLQAFTNTEGRELSSVNNIEAPIGNPAKFRFVTGGGQVIINAAAGLRSEDDYGLEVGSYNTPQIKPVYGTFFTFWGSPADHGHDSQRCKRFVVGGTPLECAAGGENTAFLTNPLSCAEEALSPPKALINVNTWQDPGLFFLGNVMLPPVTGCESLHFEADFTFEPSDTKSDSTASFKTSLTVPSEGLTNPAKLTTPEIKKTVVQLPEGVVLNASGADGLAACSEQQIGLKNEIDPSTGLPVPLAMPNPIRFDKAPNTCPEASKIGTGELKTALLEEPLKGALYLAAQGDGNPFGSLFAIYLVIEDPRHGIFIKLPGEVEPDPVTGQMTVTFENLPQLPFTRLDLSLKGGNRSALASPTTCGNYVTTATNTPWSAPESGPPTESSNGFEINQGPNGLSCAKTPQERPFDIGWKAGAEGTQAGASSPFSFQITRPDGSQELTSLELNTPKGLSASLKGIPYCSPAQIAQAEGSTGRQELANPACPAASQVGALETGAGSGPSPFYVNGKIYLAGPYKGAPISVVAVTPAVAGPFDLGNVVVRSAVFINRSTAQVTAKTDPIPQILKGVVLRIKDVRIKLDHKDWTINPTSCDASSVNLKATGNSGATAERSTRFQVGGCQNLAFGPKLKANLKGGTKRGAHPAFTATVNFPAGQANTKDVQVALPHSEFLDQAHINTICTRVQAAANACPQGSIYGYAEAETPLIDGKLTGPVFLKSSDHQLPDLAIALKGPDNQPVEVEFQGRIDSVKAQIRNTIEGLPDVPVTKFVLSMKGGRKGLLVNSRNLCSSKATKMTVKMTGQNNKQSESRPTLTRTCKGKKVKKASKRHKRSPRLNRLIAVW